MNEDDLDGLLSELDENTKKNEALVVRTSVPEQSLDENKPASYSVLDDLARADEICKQIIENYQADRVQCQEIIDICMDRVDPKVAATEPKAVWVEALVKAVENKANIAFLPIKMIEARAKLIAATKASNITINNNNTNMNSGEAAELAHTLTNIQNSDDP